MPVINHVTDAGGMLTDVVPAPRAWMATDLGVEDWSVVMSPASIAEIGQMAKVFGTSPASYLSRTASAQDAPHLAQCMVEYAIGWIRVAAFVLSMAYRWTNIRCQI